jgi:hypothetical protein
MKAFLYLATFPVVAIVFGVFVHLHYKRKPDADRRPRP